MASESKWFESFTGKFFSLFSRREVKTPLAFFFRVVTAVSAIVLLSLYLLHADSGLIFKVCIIGLAVLIGLFLAVFIFAWFKPVNLVYGETGHRAERRFSMGTEQKELAAEEVATLQGQTNPALPSTALPNTALPSTGAGGGA